MELLEIVDENGNPTGEILERTIAHEKNLLHNEVACFIINNQKQVLLQKRSLTKKYSPGKWALCAGHVEAHENLKTAILREIEEELGIKVSEKDIIPYGEKEIKIRSSNSHVTYYYTYKTNLNIEDFSIQKEELDEVKWFDIDEVVNMLKNHDKSLTWSEPEEKIPLFANLKKYY